MKKSIVAVSLAALFASSALAGAAYAQQPQREHGDRERPRMTDADRSALTDARLAGLKAGLKLTPDQEKLWPGVESALRDSAQKRRERFAEWRKEREAREHGGPRDMVNGLRSRAEHMTEGAAEMRKLADAIDPLYKTLDEGQKRRFGILIRSGMERRGMGMRMHAEAERGPHRSVE